MKERHIQLAIESMRFRLIGLEPLEHNYAKYGKQLVFGRDEAQRAHLLAPELRAAIAWLERADVAQGESDHAPADTGSHYKTRNGRH